MSITTSNGTTIEIVRDDDEGNLDHPERYVVARNPNNPPQFQNVAIGEVLNTKGFGLGFAQYQHLGLTIGPDVLRAIADLIEQEKTE